MRSQLSLSGRCLQRIVQGKKPAARRVFYWAHRIVMRTIVYIDGYNLYYRLTQQAHWVRHTIRSEELERSQLKDVVPTPRKAARKPAHW